MQDRTINTNAVLGRIIMPTRGCLMLKQIIITAILFLCIIGVNIFIDTASETQRINREQELAIARKHYERDKVDFERLRKKHGLEATRVVIYEPGKTPYYYGSVNEKIKLK
jgi:uncharacterized protein YpmB